jgi:hypothetical protein
LRIKEQETRPTLHEHDDYDDYDDDVFLLLCLCILIVIRVYFYCYVCSVLGILFPYVVLCTVCMLMCTVLLRPAVNPIAVNKYIIYHIISYHFILKEVSFISDFIHIQTDIQLVGETYTFRGN